MFLFIVGVIDENVIVNIKIIWFIIIGFKK